MRKRRQVSRPDGGTGAPARRLRRGPDRRRRRPDQPIGDARVEPAIEQVRDQVEEDDEAGEDEGDGHDHGRVVGEHRVDEQRADARDAEDLLGHDGAAEHGRHLQRDERHDRDQRVAGDVPARHRAVGQALGAGRRHVVEPRHVEHGRAHVAGVGGGLEEAEHADRHDRLPDMPPEPAPARSPGTSRLVDEGQPVELQREDQDEQEAGEEGRQREAHEGERVRDLVEQRIGPERRVDADRHGDRERQDLRGADDEQRRRDALADQVVDVDAAGEGEAPVALHHGGEPAEVAHEDRVVEPELRPQRLAHLGRHVRIARRAR